MWYQQIYSVVCFDCSFNKFSLCQGKNWKCSYLQDCLCSTSVTTYMASDPNSLHWCVTSFSVSSFRAARTNLKEFNHQNQRRRIRNYVNIISHHYRCFCRWLIMDIESDVLVTALFGIQQSNLFPNAWITSCDNDNSWLPVHPKRTQTKNFSSQRQHKMYSMQTYPQRRALLKVILLGDSGYVSTRIGLNMT